MWAIESRLKRDPGLYRWVGGETAERFLPGDPALKTEAAAGPLLVMIHGTGSNTSGSFDALQSASRAYWKPFEDRYGDRVLAFEHRTLSESPAENALQLARALPEGATLHLVTHSRGGLVGDLLCLVNFDELIAGYALDAASLAEADPAERAPSSWKGSRPARSATCALRARRAARGSRAATSTSSCRRCCR